MVWAHLRHRPKVVKICYIGCLSYGRCVQLMSRPCLLCLQKHNDRPGSQQGLILQNLSTLRQVTTVLSSINFVALCKLELELDCWWTMKLAALDVHISPMFVESWLETVDRWCFDNVLWQIVPIRNYSVAEEVLPNVQSRSGSEKLHTVSSECADCRSLLEECYALTFSFPVNILYTSMTSPRKRPFSCETPNL